MLRLFQLFLYSIIQAVTVSKKKSKKSAAKEFNPKFSFEDNFADNGFTYDPMMYAKKKRQLATTLDEKIFQARKERKKQTQVSYKLFCTCNLIFSTTKTLDYSASVLTDSDKSSYRNRPTA